MTSRDFRLIAAALADARAYCETREQERGVERAVGALAVALTSTNPLFDRSRFTAAASGAPLASGDRPRTRDYR